MAAIVPSLYCRDVAGHLAWLERAFGFETCMVVTNPDGSLGHCEIGYQGLVFNVGKEWADWTKAPADVGGVSTQSLNVEIEGDFDAHCEQARAAGAQILAEPEDQFYGHRTYTARDPEGHVWRFTQVIRPMTLAEMSKAGGRPIRARL